MNNELLKFISGFESLNEEEVHALAAAIPVETFKKGTILLKEGELSTKCYFVLKGCIRKYYLLDGEEKTTAFYTEKQAVASFTIQTLQIPSNHYLVCAEDSTLIIGYLDQEQEMFRRFPKLEAITRAMMEQDLGKNQQELDNYITSSPKQRYLTLLKTRPELLQRFPQHQIASYLGMTPESLSRIRKRISLKDAL